MYLTYREKKKRYYKSLQFEDQGTHRNAGAKKTFVEEAMGEPEVVLKLFSFPNLPSPTPLHTQHFYEKSSSGQHASPYR